MNLKYSKEFGVSIKNLDLKNKWPIDLIISLRALEISHYYYYYCLCCSNLTLYEEESDKKDISMYSMLNPIIREKKNSKSTSWKWVERMDRTETIETSGNPSDFIPIILLSIMRDYWACNRFFFSFSLLNLVDSSIR